VSEDGSEDSPGARRRPSAGGQPPAGQRDEGPQRRRRVVHGPVAVDVVDRRGPDSGPDGEDLDLDRWGLLAASAAYGEGVRRPAELGLAFVDEAEITELAAGWLQSDHPTDVLAFPVETSTRRALRAAPAGDAPLLMGDVIVCPPVAARQAGQAGRAPADEMALLIVHGVLHLLGHDHAGPLESLRMKRRTRTLLARLYRSGAPDASATTGEGGRTG